MSTCFSVLVIVSVLAYRCCIRPIILVCWWWFVSVSVIPCFSVIVC